MVEFIQSQEVVPCNRGSRHVSRHQCPVVSRAITVMPTARFLQQNHHPRPALWLHRCRIDFKRESHNSIGYGVSFSRVQSDFGSVEQGATVKASPDSALSFDKKMKIPIGAAFEALKKAAVKHGPKLIDRAIESVGRSAVKAIKKKVRGRK